MSETVTSEIRTYEYIYRARHNFPRESSEWDTVVLKFQPIVEVKNAWNYTSTPHTSS